MPFMSESWLDCQLPDLQSTCKLEKSLYPMSDSKPYGTSKRCYETHPGLKIGGHTVYGGNCSAPIVKDADVYVALDQFTNKGQIFQPWNPAPKNNALYTSFPITDQHAPKDVHEFKRMLEWLHLQLIAEKKIHIGCIGGHGRTGLVLAALVTLVTEEKDSIAYVRKNYCVKAVESKAQVNFLSDNFGITPIEVERRDSKYSRYTSDDMWDTKGRLPKIDPPTYLPKRETSTSKILPIPSKKSVWG